MTDDAPLTETVEQVRSSTGDDEVTVEEIACSVDDSGLLPLILLPALITVTPLSGVPGVAIVSGLTIALLMAEHMFGCRKLFLPRRLKQRSIDGDKLQSALDRLSPVIRWIDAHTRRRLSFLFHRPLIWVPQSLCLLTGLVMPFLELIPFSSSAAAMGVCFLVMAMLTRDGVFFLLALLPYGGFIYLLLQVLL